MAIKNIFQKLIKYLSLRNIFLLVGIIFFLVILGQVMQSDTIEKKESKISSKSAQTILWGEWQPNSTREVLTTLSSSGDINVSSEVSGTIDDVFVRIGDRVRKGQILATFQKFNDATQVAYENAVRNYEIMQLSAQNSVQSAEISLETAKTQLEQTRSTQEQTYAQTFETLRTQAKNSETTASNALDWADRILGASTRFRYQLSATQLQIGSNDKINKQSTKNLVEDLVRQKENLLVLPTFRPTDKDVLRYAQARLSFLQKVQEVVRSMDRLIRNTSLSSRISVEERNAFQTEAESFSAKVDGEILSLENKIETAKTQDQSKKLAILQAENSVRNAEAALQLTKTQSHSSVATARNSVQSAGVSKSDLEVRAPLDGKISAKNISPFDQVSVGQVLFSVVSETIAPKAVGYITKDELNRLLTKEMVQIKLSNNEILPVKKSYLSFKTDPESQKIRVEFQFDKYPEGVFVGSFVKILIPTQSKEINLVPITALSFEPDGAEVLILDAKSIARRKKVQYGKIIGDAVEIQEGLDLGTKVLKYRNRVHAGEKIEEL
jgi:multidrug efflux pump subunit AcrA (membrane-fusion protein)